MCEIGLIDFLKQTGTVKLHPQNSLSDVTYRELKSARKMIKNYIKDFEVRVDIYDANTLPEEKKPYGDFPNQVRVEVNHLLRDKIVLQDFHENEKKEPLLRQIFRFVDQQCGVEESPLEQMINATRKKYDLFLRTSKTTLENKVDTVV